MRHYPSILLTILLMMTYGQVLAAPQIEIKLVLPETVYVGFEFDAVVKISNPPEGGLIKILWIRLRTPWGSTPLEEVGLEMPPGTNLSQKISLRIPLGAKAPAFANLKAIIRIYDFEEAKQITIESEGVNVLVEKASPQVILEVNTDRQNLTPEEPFELLVSYSIADYPGEESPTLDVFMNDTIIVKNLSLSQLSDDLSFNLTAPNEEGLYEIEAVLNYIVGEERRYTTIYVSRKFGFREEEAWNQILLANQSLEFANALYNEAKDQIEVPEKAPLSIQFAEIRISQAIEAFQEANNSVFHLARESYNASVVAIEVILQAYQDEISILLENLNQTFKEHITILTKYEIENITSALQFAAELKDKIPQEPENAATLFETAVSEISKANLTLNNAISKYRTKIKILSLLVLTTITISFFGVILMSRSLFRKIASS